MVLLYWDIGRMILDRQEREGWGAKVIDRLSADLREAYPDMQGFSARNLLFMRSFAEACPDAEKVKQLVSQLSWRKNDRTARAGRAHHPRSSSDQPEPVREIDWRESAHAAKLGAATHAAHWAGQGAAQDRCFKPEGD
jgi:hypothetical protein